MTDVPPVAAIADVLALRGRRGWLTPPLRPIVAPPVPVTGHAITVELRAEPAGRGLGELHELLSRDLRGAVVVVAGASAVAGAVWGEILSSAAQHAGAIAVLVHGAVRDRAAMAAGGFPVYAVEECVVGPAGRVSVATVGAPVTLDGVGVDPGDTIVADGGGALCLPAGSARQALGDAVRYAEAEAAVLRDLGRGAVLQAAYGRKRTVVEQLLAEWGR
jgi:regulator of RNase E activity RraA